ncbi:predicted protein [Uncinocarpus reesii 1704]|uniref:Uncharacterized protein n=1 Tax=Uncinocarpus reesii (strain UAMH 1704) TaxID=336963 RepID=C4JWF1_UNCRE|nr:uncharacterized protein UREG_06893 [Uncinocarpus reesii 1704]EEP82028.1 predicted protein [Uncinocarpus reesii 1704]
MEKGLAALDAAMGEDALIYAFSPITIISPGGYVAVTFFQNRASTEDIDFFIDPEYARDQDILGAIRKAMRQIGRSLDLGESWINDAVSLFLTLDARRSLFEDAQKQNIVLWEGANLKVLAAPLEWGLETKLRRLSTKPNHPKTNTDMSDILVILKFLKDRDGAP